MTAALSTLLIGLAVGYLAQRSRMCFVGGVRDFILVRDTELLKGLFAFALTAWIGFPVAAWLAGVPRVVFTPADSTSTALTVAAGLGVGLWSTLANGCPLRQHVLAAQGIVSSWAYLAGFLGGAILFQAWVGPLIFRWLP
jgi:uncharacterized protein